MAEVTQQAEAAVEATSGDQSDYEYSGRFAPDRVAWVVLLIAFALFCTVTFSIGFGVYYFLFQSSASLPAILEVSKGTAGITGSDMIETVERERKELSNTITSISTDSLSQATIQFHDVAEDEREVADLLAAITLQGNTFVTFNYANRPRFEWSQNPQRLQFSGLRGQLDILVTGADRHHFEMNIFVDELGAFQGVQVQFMRNGRFRLSASEDEVRLLSLSGMATAFFRDDPGGRKTVRTGEELVARLGNRAISTRPSVKSVVSSADFSLPDLSATRQFQPIEPRYWDCQADLGELPYGAYTLGEFDGRVGVRLYRFENARTHGEIRCSQAYADGVDVGAYDTMRVLATIRFDYQSLSLCGKDGSECPLMLRIDFINVRGNARSHWIRGFYYEEHASGEYKAICNTCFRDHVNINSGVWYTFDSGNLLSLMTEDTRPARITSVTFYASGHQFDTIVSEMRLLFSNTSAATAESGG